MIEIINDWYITVETSPVNYTVRRGEGKKDKKNAWVDKPIAFFGSLQKAVKFIRDQVIAEKLSSASLPLSEALRSISDVDTRFENIINVINV